MELFIQFKTILLLLTDEIIHCLEYEYDMQNELQHDEPWQQCMLEHNFDLVLAELKLNYLSFH